ncbi:MAG TPA: sigma-70 family RNA polymerase sigma factor [Adhaeribacter sp.]|nr:sigma-70 family RNA polymerase sigma factor [Adhaeribacter sp.]
MASDNNYIERLRNGDESCLQEMYDLYRVDFTSWAERRFSLEPEEARDAFQNCLIAFYENILSGKLNTLSSSPRTYLFAIGKNKILKSKKNLPLYANLDDFPDINHIEDDNTEAEMEDERNLAVHKALQQLGPDCQKVLELFYFRNCKMEQIAQALNYKNENVTKVKKASCLKKLAGIFKNRLPI